MVSNFEFKNECIKWIKSKLPNNGSILDVGIINGVWSEYLKNDFIIDAVESNKQNIARYKLNYKYNKIFNGDVRTFLFNNYDLIILNDINSLMSVEEVQRLIEYMSPRCKELLLVETNTGTKDLKQQIHNNLEETLKKFPNFMPLCNRENQTSYIKKQPAFSIIIPAHNEAGRINVALQSIADQSMKDYEVIVVCDNCTDETESIAKEYGFKTISGVFGSAGEARNAGLNNACGEYIQFLDSDDHFLHSEAFSMMQWFAKQTINADVIAFGFIFGYLGFMPVNGNNGSMFPNVWSKLWKRSFIGETRFQPLNFAEDEYFCRDIFTRGAQIARWDTPFVYYTYPRIGSLTDKHLRG